MTVPYAPSGHRHARDRVTRCLFHWRAQDGLEALSGQVLTFNRDGRAGSCLGSGGLLGSNYESYDAPRLCAIDISTRQWKDAGLLLEDAATNLCLRSAGFDDAVWTKTNFTVGANTLLSRGPDGAFFADFLNETAVNSSHFVEQTITIVSADYVSFSVFVKPNGRDYGYFGISDTVGTNGFYYYVNLLTGAILNPTNAGAAVMAYSEVVPLQDGWWELRIGGRINGGVTSVKVQIGGATSTPGLSYLGVVGTGLFVWGAQFVKSSVGVHRQSYIGPTLGSSIASVREDLTCTLPLDPRLTPNLTFYFKSARPWWANVSNASLLYSFPRPFYFIIGGTGAYIQLYGSATDPDLGGIEIKDDAAVAVNVNGATPGMPAGVYAEIVGQVEGLSTGARARCDFGSGFGAWSSYAGTLAGPGTTLAIGGTGSGAPWLAPIICLKIAKGLLTLQEMREIP